MFAGVTRPLQAPQSPPPAQLERQLSNEPPHLLPSILENTHAAFPVVEAQPGEEPLPRGNLDRFYAILSVL